MTGVLKELVFGLGRGFGIYFSQRNEFIEQIMTPGRPLKKSR
jgi:putative component of toxin-antitoxin plasmid stabilization module